MRKRVQTLILLFVFLFMMSVSLVSAKENILETFFKPFENLDIAKIYEKHSVVIDFFLYLMIFTGLSQAILSKKFQGRGGKALIIAIGITLSIGMITAEKNLGFTIKTFGPVAAWIFIFLVSVILFHTIKQIGAGNVAAGSIALVVTYFIMRGLLPQFFDLLQKNEYTNGLHSALFIAVLIALVKGIIALFPGKIKIVKEQYALSKTPKEVWNKIFPTEEFEKEYSVLKEKLERITKKDKKNSKEIISDLIRIIEIIKEYGKNPEYRDLIKQKLYEIIPKEHEIFERIGYLREVNKVIENFEIGVIKSIKDKYNTLSPEEKEHAGKEIKAEILKIKAERRIEDFASRAFLYHENFKHCLKNAEVNLNSGWIKEVVKWINPAIRYEEKIEKLFSEIKAFEKLLVKITIEELKSIE